MNDNTTTQFKTEGDPAFPVENTENDNSAESSTGEETTTEQTQSQEGEENSGATADGGETGDSGGDAGFADHPRWKEREEDWNKRFNEQEKRHVDEIDNLRKEVEEKIGGKKSEDTTTGEVPPIPSWFGGDEEQWKEYLKHEETRIERARDEAVKAVTSKQSEEQKAIDDATKYFNDTIVAIESDKTINPQGEKVDRNKLLKFVLDNELVDTKGRWNYRAGYQMMKAGVVNTKAEDLKERKKIAGATTSENRAETKQSPVTTSADFSKPGARPW